MSSTSSGGSLGVPLRHPASLGNGPLSNVLGRGDCDLEGKYLAATSSDEELLYDPDIMLLTESMRRKYLRELSDVRRIIWTWSEHIDQFLLPYIGFSLFLAPERYFRISRFAGLATMLFAVVLGAFVAGGGKYGCGVCTVAYPLYQCWKFLRAAGTEYQNSSNDDPGQDGGEGDAESTTSSSQLGRHFNEYVQWGTYWVIVGAFEVAEQVAAALFFPGGLHWLYWYTKLLLLLYCYFPRTQGATVLYWTVASPWAVAKARP